MAEITIFRTKEQQDKEAVQQDVVDTLEKLLARAKEGQLIGLAYVTISPEGNTGTGWDGYGRKDLSFGISLLNQRYHAACLEQKSLD